MLTRHNNLPGWALLILVVVFIGCAIGSVFQLIGWLGKKFPPTVAQRNQSAQNYEAAKEQAYLQLKQAFLAQMDAFSMDGPIPLPGPRADHRQSTLHAEAWFATHDHLVQVAGITIGQIRKLEAAGIDTVAKLAESGSRRIPNLNGEMCQKIQNQARTQVKARKQAVGSPQPFEILPPNPATRQHGIASMPPASAGDVYFVDEAGQVSLANVAAMSRATDDLVLLGDQNQLPMPAQGTHPGECRLP